MQESRGSRRHSTTSFSEIEIVIETDTSYQMFVVLSFWDGDKALLQSIKITVLTFLVEKKVAWIFACSCLYYDNPRKNFKSNLVLHVFESKDL